MDKDKASSFVLKGDICYSQSPEKLFCLSGAFLVVKDGLSAGVFEKLPEAFASLPLTDYGHRLIIPGLTDLHVHASQYGFRATGMNLELIDWLKTCAFQEETKFRDISYAKKAYAYFVNDLVHSPNTRACIFATLHKEATEVLMDMLEESGLVCMVGKVNMDRNSPSELCEKDAETAALTTRDWLETCKSKHYRNTSPILTPRFIPACSDRLMRFLGDIQKEYGLPLQSHLSENPDEVELVKRLCPQSRFYGDVYSSFGLFGGEVPTIMAHCIWSGDEELELLVKRGVWVAHCPESNANLASGIAPVRKMLRKGIHVGLGSDIGAGSRMSIFQAAALAIQESKLYRRYLDKEDPPLSFSEAFYLATVGGGSFFGKAGSFEEGYECDALVLDEKNLPSPFPLNIPQRLERIIYLSDANALSAKYVRGRRIV